MTHLKPVVRFYEVFDESSGEPIRLVASDNIHNVKSVLSNPDTDKSRYVIQETITYRADTAGGA